MADFVEDDCALGEWAANGLGRVTTQALRDLLDQLAEELRQREAAEGLSWKVTLSGA